MIGLGFVFFLVVEGAMSTMVEKTKACVKGGCMR